MFHWKAIGAKTFSHLNTVVEDVMKDINFSKSHAFNTYRFANLCDEIE